MMKDKTNLNDAFGMLRELLERDRSYRRFDESESISEDKLKALVELTRFCASGRNIQPLKYKLINSTEDREKIFPLLAWAGYLKDWPGPKEGERPAAYIIQCLDTRITDNCLCDDGLQLQSITLGATAMGLGGCIIKAFNKPKLMETLSLPEWADPRYVFAIGVPVEKVMIEKMDDSNPDPYKYYRDTEEVHHVPKRGISELLIE